MPGELILLVDDEPNIVRLARMYLERDGYRVQSVGEGIAALRAVEELNPDLMVLDLMLPEVDGLEICRRLRAQENPLPILMLTDRDEDVDKILGPELGADDYVVKPFNPRELVACVKALLRRGERLKQPVGGQYAPPIHLGDLFVDPARRWTGIGDRP